MNISNQGSQQSLDIGGRKFLDLANLITLTAAFAGSGQGNSGLRRVGATSAYTPSGSNKFYIHAIRITACKGDATTLAYIAQADNDVGDRTNTGATNSVTQVWLPIPAAGGVFEWAFAQPTSIANAKYLAAVFTSSACVGSIQVYGYEGT